MFLAALEVWRNGVIDENLIYIHYNSVEEGLVFRTEQCECVVVHLIMQAKKFYWKFC